MPGAMVCVYTPDCLAFMRLLASHLLEVAWLHLNPPTMLRGLCRCPPGHGDIYSSLLGSGMLDRLIKAGIKYLFVSNSDNLGATLDLDLLAYFASSKKGFVCEVAERTAADKKGGHLAKRKSDGRLVLRESAMCPDEDKGDFENISKSVCPIFYSAESASLLKPWQ